jgi:hypothetical protein
MIQQSRQVAKKFSQLLLGEVRTLLYSRIHEQRLVALLILAGGTAVAHQAAGKKKKKRS